MSNDNLHPYPSTAVVDPASAREFTQLHSGEVIKYLKNFLGATECFVTMSGNVWISLPETMDGYTERRYLQDKELSQLMTAMKEENNFKPSAEKICHVRQT
jgi:hypothetical protein